jgi:hypothetical protein
VCLSGSIGLLKLASLLWTTDAGDAMEDAAIGCAIEYSVRTITEPGTVPDRYPLACRLTMRRGRRTSPEFVFIVRRSVAGSRLRTTTRRLRRELPLLSVHRLLRSDRILGQDGVSQVLYVSIRGVGTRQNDFGRTEPDLPVKCCINDIHRHRSDSFGTFSHR